MIEPAAMILLTESPELNRLMTHCMRFIMEGFGGALRMVNTGWHACVAEGD